GRQRLGMDVRLLSGASPDFPCLLWAREPSRRDARGQLRSAATRARDPEAGDEGRFVPVRAELLSSLPAGSAYAAADRYVDLPSRLSLHPALTPSIAGDGGRS